MATPLLSKIRLPGTLGEILVDVRAADRQSGGPAVIVLHGFKGFKDWGMFPPFADRLARSGFTAVSLNVSGSGVDDNGDFTFPDRFGHNTFSAELHDLDVVKQSLLSGALSVAPPTSIGIVGHSRGGGIAILATAASPDYRALVTWAGIAHVRRWRPEQMAVWRAEGQLDVVNARTGQVLPMYVDTVDDIEQHAQGKLDIGRAASSIRVPWLLLHGEKDEAVPLSEAERLAALQHAPSFERVAIGDAGHTFGAVHPFAGPTPALEEVFDRTVRFFTQHLG
jgi:dienelactone hydrolase